MDRADWTTLAAMLAALMSGGGLVTFLKVILDRKAGVRGEEREAKRDMIADRDGLIQTLFERQSSLEGRVKELEGDKTFLDRVKDAYADHIDRLENDAWAVYHGLRAATPPPARPIITRKDSTEHG